MAWRFSKAVCQGHAIRDQATTRGVTVAIVIDFVHVLEYIWKAAWTFFYPGDPDAQTWVADHARTVSLST